jgi:acylglycerol lipase
VTPEELKEGTARSDRWVFYSVWEMSEPAGGWEGGGRGRGRDLVMVHGMLSYVFADNRIERLWTPLRASRQALPQSGFSSNHPGSAIGTSCLTRLTFSMATPQGGSTLDDTDDRVNSYVPSLLLLPSALHTVLTDLVCVDLQNGREQRKVFLSGG